MLDTIISAGSIIWLVLFGLMLGPVASPVAWFGTGAMLLAVAVAVRPGLMPH